MKRAKSLKFPVFLRARVLPIFPPLLLLKVDHQSQNPFLPDLALNLSPARFLTSPA
jgi:hypothetical protein